MENAIKNGKRPSEKRLAAAGNAFARQQPLSDGLLPPPVAENALFPATLPRVMCRQTRLRSRNRRKKPAFGNFPLFIKITRLPACQPLRFKLHCTTNRCGSTAQAKLAKVKNRIEKPGRSPNSIRNRPFCRKRPVLTRGADACGGRLKTKKRPSESVASAQLRFQTASVFPKNVQRFSSTSSTNLLPA